MCTIKHIIFKMGISKVRRCRREFFMKRTIITVLMFFLIAICQSWTWAAKYNLETLEDVVEEEIWIIFAHDPAGYLHDAWRDFLIGDMQGTAYNIRKTKALLKLEATRAEKETRDDLAASIKQLEEMIMSLEEGTTPTRKALRQAFAQTEYALSKHHYHKALHYKAKGDYDKMIYALDAAATHLLHRSTWADLKLDPNDALAAKEARSLTRKAKRGEKWLPGKLREAIEGIGRGIRRLGERLKQAKEGS
jgi:hypothetical protein